MDRPVITQRIMVFIYTQVHRKSNNPVVKKYIQVNRPRNSINTQKQNKPKIYNYPQYTDPSSITQTIYNKPQNK